MSLIEINPDVKLLVKELKRIANAMEAYMMLEHNYYQAPAEKGEKAADELDVSYSTDEETTKREFEIAIGRATDVLAEEE